MNLPILATEASGAVACTVLLGVVFILSLSPFAKSLLRFCGVEQSEKNERKDARLTRIAEWLQWLWIPLWLFDYGDKGTWPMMSALLQYLGLGILLCVFLALYETIRKMGAYDWTPNSIIGTNPRTKG